jgi:flavin-dependent dehydrogenase
MSQRVFDVAVVGGGPAGAAAAIRLARAGAATVVIDADRRHGDRIGESLAPSARLVLEQIGVWEQLQAAGHLPCFGNRSSWGGSGIDTYDFLCDPYGHGWHLDRRRFEAMLVDEAVRAGCVWQERARLEALGGEAGAWRGRLSHAGARRTIAARAILDASGRGARAARLMGARRVTHDRLVAVVAFLVPGGSPAADSTTLVEAMPDGWWYSALLPDGRLATAFMTDADLLQAGGGARPREWGRRLAATTHTLGRIAASGCRLVEPPAVAAAGSWRLDRAAGPGWAAAGDAAAAYDPLSSHGIATALAAGWDAAGALLARADGDGGALPDYAQRIRDSYARYLEMRAAYYRLERRWPASPFWNRRHAAVPASGGMHVSGKMPLHG